jgi:hypothetical protein
MMMKALKQLLFAGVIFMNLPALAQPIARPGAPGHFSTAGSSTNCPERGARLSISMLAGDSLREAAVSLHLLG